MTVTVLHGDCREVLRTLEPESVHCVVTSPPYFGLRDYGVSGQIGLEPTPDEYIAELVAVFAEVKRVLRPDGTVWLNIGDSYVANRGNSVEKPGYDNKSAAGHANLAIRQFRIPGKPKDLLMIPARVALALQADGWWLRSDIIWAKPNPMPESVQGSHFSRHMVTIADYERLSGLPYINECAGDDWAGDMPSLSEIEIPCGKAPLSAKPEGASDRKSAGGAAGRKGTAAAVRGIGSRAAEQQEISADPEGQGGRTEAVCELQSTAQKRNGDNHSAGVDRDFGAPQSPLLLLPQEEIADDAGSHNPTQQGRQKLRGKHRPGVPLVQLQEAEQDTSDLLVGCPGCDRCSKYHGYLFHMSAGRPTSAHEHIFLLAKSERYWFDADAVREEAVAEGQPRTFGKVSARDKDYTGTPQDRGGNEQWGRTIEVSGRNIRNVWTVATAPYPGSHFACMPPDLAERCIKAGTSEKGCCSACGAPWGRIVEKTGGSYAERKAAGVGGPYNMRPAEYQTCGSSQSVTLGWQPSCKCEAGVSPCVVLDPFGGAGTTGLVADRLQRNAILIELNPEYVTMAQDRIRGDAPLFAI